MATGGVDLHIHTSASDGSLTPSQVVEAAARMKLSALAITDHDNLSGISEALKMGERLGVEVVPGLEISTEEDKEEIHILGYFVDYQAGWLNKLVNGLQKKREERVRKILIKLASLGVYLQEDDVREVAGKGSLGRPHVAKALLNKGYVSSISEAFRRYLANYAPAYVPRQHVTPAQAVSIIRKAQGVAVLAHPGFIKDERRITELLGLGIQGIECWHSEQDGAISRKYVKLARHHGLVVTGGSDFHGRQFGSNRQLGKPRVDKVVYEELQAFYLGMRAKEVNYKLGS